MGGYIVIKNSFGCEIGVHKVDTSKEIADELIRVIKENMLVFEEGDTITFESR